MSLNRWIHRHSLPFVVIAALLGCVPPSGEGAPELPPTVPEAAIPVTDPATVARVERVRQALEQGLDVNKADPDGRTATMMAAFEGHTEVVEIFLGHGAKVDQVDSFGRTALMYASSGPFPKTVELLLVSGAEVNRADSTEGWTALMMAAAEGQRPVVEALLKHGADIGLTDQDGDAAVDHARERGQGHIVAMLESDPGGK